MKTILKTLTKLIAGLTCVTATVLLTVNLLATVTHYTGVGFNLAGSFLVDYSNQYFNYQQQTYQNAITYKNSQIEKFANSHGFVLTRTVLTQQDLDDYARSEADAQGVQRSAVRAIFYHESKLDPDALSHAGAIGVAQINPKNVKFCGLRSANALLDPKQNIKCGVKIWKDALRMTGGRVSAALKVYNGGPRALTRPMPETIAYVPAVIALYKRFAVEEGERARL